jgi:predicted RNA-binding Zn-ribbon protein involved in translation (DUF1610 family)
MKRKIGLSDKFVQIQVMDPLIIAPCGINCSLCRAHIRDRHPCPGCRSDDTDKSKSCVNCGMKTCPELAAGDFQFCFSCSRFPCATIQHLDTRYRTRYGLSVIANLERIQAVGVEMFVREEATRWACPQCGSRLCMHKTTCMICGYTRRME